MFVRDAESFLLYFDHDCPQPRDLSERLVRDAERIKCHRWPAEDMINVQEEAHHERAFRINLGAEDMMLLEHVRIFSALFHQNTKS